MGLEKNYHDSGGKKCNILQLMEKEPERTANRIQKRVKIIEQIQDMPDNYSVWDNIMNVYYHVTKYSTY